MVGTRSKDLRAGRSLSSCKLCVTGRAVKDWELGVRLSEILQRRDNRVLAYTSRDM